MAAGREQRQTIFVGFDAMSPALVREWADAGHLPTFARVLRSAASVEVEHEPGFYVGSIWPTAFSGVSVDRHGSYTGIELAPRAYGYRAAPLTVPPFWAEVGATGQRVAVIDPPFWRAQPGLDGLQLIEWGCHDRFYGAHSEPAELLDEVCRDVGRHPIGMVDHPDGLDRFAPCDQMHLDGRRRGIDEVCAFHDTLTEALEARERVTKYVLDRGPFDLVVDVVAETHCAGHHLWAMHDPDHPDHDPAAVARMGGDPLLDAYRRCDAILDQHLSSAGADAVVFVSLSHGMRSHFDGTHLLDEVLWRLDQAYQGLPTPWVGPATRRAGRALRAVPDVAARRLQGFSNQAISRILGRRTEGVPPLPDIPPSAERIWSPVENNTVSGAIRLNRVGREPHGVLGAAMADHAVEWLRHELLALVNLDDGGPVIEDVYPTSDHYHRHDDDGLPDVIVEWRRDLPIERVWSPTIGMLRRPYEGLRTGDHENRGALLAVGPDIAAGSRGTITTVDIAPTVAAAAGCFLEGVDGTPATALLPGGSQAGKAIASGARSLSARRPRRAPVPDQSTELAALRHELVQAHRRIDGLAEAHHATWEKALEAGSVADMLRDIVATTTWIRGEVVSPDLLISVVTPTCGRIERLQRSVASVLTQSYERLELVVVDDASTDGTADWLATVDDTRLRIVRNEASLGEGGARNAGLDVATGDVVTFLDDDNTFDPDWLRAVAWLFQEYPDTSVAYGARVVDDVDRHHGRTPGGMPWVQLNRWDRAVNADRCLVDVNVLAHRRGDRRFDPQLPIFTDWDYLLGLTQDVDPVVLPVIAALYTTSAVDRATDRMRDSSEPLYHRVRDRWRQ